MELAEGFTDEQQALWDEYADAHESSGSVGEVVNGFQWICDLEGVPAPSEQLIRATLA